MSGVGGADSGLVGGLEIAVIDDEIISLLKHIVAGCAVTEETLAFDVMRDVILRDGVFLAERHTVHQMRQGALWTPVVSERRSVSFDDPGAGVLARARARANEILRTHQVEPLEDDVSRQLDEIMARARRELVKG
jgi:trimethylamine--corrinoid protein Co-methyltransferase